MPIRAVVFDIGGVLEITPKTGWEKKWETYLQLPPGGLDEHLMSIWQDGSSGKISEEEVEANIAQILGLNPQQLTEFMHDLWSEYLGTLNLELAAYFTSLRPQYQTAIISNSFAGARRQEQERYGFMDMCDLIVYSHEEGIRKPDKRIFELACARLNIAPGEMIFLDDVAESVAAARALGIHAFLFKETQQAIADIEACLLAENSL